MFPTCAHCRKFIKGAVANVGTGQEFHPQCAKKFFKRLNAKRPGKYNTAGTSKLEDAVHEIFQAREKAGEIAELRRQVVLVLQDGPRSERITWRVDFGYLDRATGAQCYAEAKGVETAEYRLKLKLFRANPPGRLEIWKGNYRRPELFDVVEPKEGEADGNGS